MGSFCGYAIPGTVFFSVGAWHTIQASRKYLQCKNKQEPFKSSTWYAGDCCFNNLTDFPMEPCLKAMLCLVGFLIGITNDDQTYGVFDHHINKKQSVIYIFFGLNALLEVITHHKLINFPFVDHISYVVAYGVEFILFYFRRSEPDVNNRVHFFMLFIILISIISVFSMMLYPHYIEPAFSHSFGLLLQGTWLWQIGLISNNPIPELNLDNNINEQDNKSVLLFLCHFGSVLLLVIIIHLVTRWFNRQNTVTLDENRI